MHIYMLNILKIEDMIDDSYIKIMMSLRHVSGFNVHNEVRIKQKDAKDLKNVIVNLSTSKECIRFLKEAVCKGKIRYVAGQEEL
jgi:hypothetical protein